MIGHNKKNVRKPNEGVISEFDTVQQRSSDFSPGQLGLVAVLTNYCNKINFFGWVDPQRHFVR